MAWYKKASVLNILIIVGAIVLVGAVYAISKDDRPVRLLPVYGRIASDSSKGIERYHKVFDFKMTDQMGHTVTLDTFKNKVFVANFFFATCQGICKRMNLQVERAAKSFAGNPDVKFVSYTVDPAHDSVPVLADYARQHDAVPFQWYFLTGDKQEIYNLACKSYIDVGDTCTVGTVVHTQNMALVDMEGHLRGFYSGTDSADVSRLIKDINLLLKEEKVNKK